MITFVQNLKPRSYSYVSRAALSSAGWQANKIQASHIISLLTSGLVTSGTDDYSQWYYHYSVNMTIIINA